MKRTSLEWIRRPPVDFLLHGGLARFLGLRGCRLYYYTMGHNFGDMLNEHLFAYLGIDVRHARSSYAQVVAIGSLLQQFEIRPGIVRVKEPVHVFGTGFIAMPECSRFIRPMIVHALRGRLSLRDCERILGCRLSNVALGDPGLLIRRIFPDAVDAEKHYDVAVVCHMSEKGSRLLGNVKLQRKSISFIDITADVRTVVRKIAECRFVLSSAMHGLICADSLGIPNRRIVLENADEIGNYKFDDYYSVFSSGVTPRAVDLRMSCIGDENIDALAREYSIELTDVNRICDMLAEKFMELRNIKHLRG